MTRCRLLGEAVVLTGVPGVGGARVPRATGACRGVIEGPVAAGLVEGPLAGPADRGAAVKVAAVRVVTGRLLRRRVARCLLRGVSGVRAVGAVGMGAVDVGV